MGLKDSYHSNSDDHYNVSKVVILFNDAIFMLLNSKRVSFSK